ncbi:MAG TPA: hypothetical protein PLZ73_08645 [bacterium]|nr:hypothetical protein [bacterium]
MTPAAAAGGGRGKLWFLAAAAVLTAGALWLRLDFIGNRPQLPVVWDAAGYNLQAREFAAAWSSWGTPDFDAHYRKAWEMALPKCELYPLAMSLVYWLHRCDFQAVRVAQGVVGTVNCLLTLLIALAVFRRRSVALGALLISALYLPAVFSEGRLLTETVAVFALLLATVLLLAAVSRGGWWWMVLAGLATALLMISRTFFQYVFIVDIPLLAAGLRFRRHRGWWWKTGLYAAAVAAVIVPRYFWTGEVDSKGRHWISGSWRNGLAIYTGIYPPNQGLQTDADPGGEIHREIFGSRGRETPIDDLYFKAYLQVLLRRPAAAVPVLLSKGGLFWHRAYNDFRQSYLLDADGIDRLNRVLLLAGVFGLGLAVGLGPRGWIFLATALYIWALCFAADAESRYTLPAMPFMIGAACWFVFNLVSGAAATWRSRVRLRLLASLGLIVATGALTWLTRPPRLLPGLEPQTAFRVWRLCAGLFALSPIPLLALVYRFRPGGGRRRWWSAAAPAVAVLLVFLAAIGIPPRWHEWKVRLQRPGQTVRQTISLPEDLERYRGAELKLDLLSGPGRLYDLVVKVDGAPVRIFQRGLSPDPGSYIASRRAFPVYLREERRHLNQVRQWYSVPLDIQKLRGRRELEVELEFRPAAAGADNYVELYGDYLIEGPGVFEGPTFSQSPRDLSLYRYLFFDDWRLWRKWDLAAPARAVSGPGGGDLAADPGLQTGRYRILLDLSRLSPGRGEFPVAVRNQEYLTDKTVLADYYNLQVWELNPWKRTGSELLVEAAHAAPGEEGGFTLVVYEDADGDHQPDRLWARSSYLTGEKTGAWSSWTVALPDASRPVFVGMSWPPGSKTRVYYERKLWPDEIFPEVMYYRPGPNAPKAYPVLTNLRVSFLDAGKK